MQSAAAQHPSPSPCPCHLLQLSRGITVITSRVQMMTCHVSHSRADDDVSHVTLACSIGRQTLRPQLRQLQHESRDRLLPHVTRINAAPLSPPPSAAAHPASPSTLSPPPPPSSSSAQRHAAPSPPPTAQQHEQQHATARRGSQALPVMPVLPVSHLLLVLVGVVVGKLDGAAVACTRPPALLSLLPPPPQPRFACACAHANNSRVWCSRHAGCSRV